MNNSKVAFTFFYEPGNRITMNLQLRRTLVRSVLYLKDYGTFYTLPIHFSFTKINT